MPILLSSFNELDSKKVSDKYPISKLIVTIYISINGGLVKSWDASPSKFWRNIFKQDCFFRPILVSVSPDLINNNILKYSPWKHVWDTNGRKVKYEQK